MQCRLIRLTRRVSTICPSITGAVTSRTGSSVKNMLPSDMPRTLPVNRTPARKSRNSGWKLPIERR